jgi:hypothetical protein
MQEDMFNDEQINGDDAHAGEMLVPIVQYNTCLLFMYCCLFIWN